MLEERRLWVLVADGAKARILKNFGHSTDEVTENLEVSKERLGEIMSDQAGSSFASVGGRRSSMELKSDPVRENEKAFARMLADSLEHSRLVEGVDELMVIAAPRTLGDLRIALSADLQQLVKLESNKDLTGLPEKTLFETVVKLRKNLLAEYS